MAFAASSPSGSHDVSIQLMPDVLHLDMAHEAADGSEPSIALRHSRTESGPVDRCLRDDVRLSALGCEGGKALQQVRPHSTRPPFCRDPRRSPGAATKSSEIAPRQRRDQPVEWHQRATIVPTLPFNLLTASFYCLNGYPQR